ncbi:uncharacterized protein BX664DRAFT_338594 [Halteromyces radiatus]|uniref:uncharacterized protein n=1 Tax=Halteromyces radiatus TaxID=101107 RepID=UPI00221EC891|nr:uncharacterized protein BX664DRAFT_338594 [Halteromyces radiatus]KAI8085132.1 hypothetical protein BX664DRAFT_338594 [Halteromyces radiatus]
MLLNVTHHTKLLNIPWVILDTNIEGHALDGPIYVKAIFDIDEYRILATNLRYTWFEYGNSSTIIKRATEYRMDIESDDQIRDLLVSLQSCFHQSENCKIRLSESGQLVIIYKDISKGFTSLSWTFDCSLLEMNFLHENASFLDGPTVLYTHFIAPLVSITQSNWLNQKNTMDHRRSKSPSPTSSSLPSSPKEGIDNTSSWLSQFYLKTDSNIENESDARLTISGIEQTSGLEDNKDSATHDDQASLTSSPTKKLSDPDKELERRTKLELDLLKKSEKGKKKRRLF